VARLRFGVPLLVKDLTELAARRRTYIVRGLYAALLFTVFGLVLHSEAAGLVGGSSQLLGLGGRLFWWVVGLQLAGIYVFLPAMVSGCITEEKEKRTLELLLVTDLTPAEIVMQKFVGRITPMLTMLLLSMPLMTVCYAYGGLSSGQVLVAALALLATCVEVGAYTVMVSALKRTGGEALWATYACGGGVLLFLSFCMAPLAAMMWGTSGGKGGVFLALLVSGFGLVPGAAIAAHGFSGLGAAMVSLLPVGYWVLLFLAKARKHLVEQALPSPKMHGATFAGALEGFFRYGDGTPKPKRPGALEGLPDDEPIVWRELGRSSLRWRKPFVYSLVAAETAALVLGLGFGSMTRPGAEASGITFLVLVLWAIAAISVTILAARPFAPERANRTLDILLTTPMSGEHIVRQKATAARRLMVLLAVPILTLIATEAIVEATRYSRAQQVGYLLAATASVLVFLPGFAWVSTLIGLRSRDSRRAMLVALGVVLVWNVAPPLLGDWLAALTRNAWAAEATYLGYLSPAALIMSAESGLVVSGDIELRLAPAAASLAASALAILMVRRACLMNADRWLGRPSVQARTAEAPAPRVPAAGGAA
jgi:ABC-type transport system involved in multi-copper enzyme maturation permease subunit